MEAVCVMLGTKSDWINSKKLLGDMKLINKLVSYNHNNMSKNLIKKVKKYTDMENFTHEKVTKSSKAAGNLAQWVIASVEYAESLHQIND